MKNLCALCVQRVVALCTSLTPPLLPNSRDVKKGSLLVFLAVFAGVDTSFAQNCASGGVNLGKLTDYLFVFTNAGDDANWQGATKGFVGNVAVNSTAAFRTSGGVPYAGTIYSDGNSIGAWNNIVSDNSGQAGASLNQTTLMTQLAGDFNNALAQINALTPTAGYNGVNASVLNGLNTQNNVAETYVIHINAGMGISSKLNVTGDANDFFIIVWDSDNNPANGYQGQVKFQSGGAVVPLGNLTPSNFINVAGDINSSGGGSTPTSPYPQGPRHNNGTGALITDGSDFSGGGYFTGYWLTTGDENGNTSSLSNGIFVGGWYSSTNSFSMTSGTSGVHVAPVCMPSVSGNVFHDPDGGFVNNSAAPAGPNVIPDGISAYLVKGGIIVGKAPVGTDGQFKFPKVISSGGYTVVISATDAALGGTPPVQTLPGGWAKTGAYNGDPNTGNSGAVGVSVPFDVPGTNVVNINFGIQQPPSAQAQTYTINGERPKAGSFIVLNGTGTGVAGNNSSPGPLRGSDPEDQATTSSLAGRTVAITGLLDNGILIYQNVPVALSGGRYLIENYDPSQLKIQLTEGTYTAMTFQYAFVDRAGVQSPPVDYIINIGSALPVMLVAFSATESDSHQALLTWATTFESNSDFFEVQHSLNGKEWQPAGIVKSHGTSAVLMKYEFLHAAVTGGVSYYRLRMVDFDGSFAFSKILSLDINQAAKISFYPNPVSDVLNLTVDRPEAVTRVRIYTISGQLVKDSAFIPQKGIDVASLANGMYVLKAHYENGRSAVAKIVISK